MLPCHQYQHLKVASLTGEISGPILNGACKEDSARLGETFGAINYDLQDFDPQEQISLYSIPNFVQGSLFAIPYPDKHFAIIVLGEILEHCVWEPASRILKEVRRVLRDDGRIVCTVPQDPRPKEVQHAPHLLIEWEGGVTSWHCQVWNDSDWNLLLKQCEFVELYEHTQVLNYGFCQGFGAVLRKAGCGS